MRSMNTAITAMKANQEKLDVISNNISNSSTTAFKSSTVNFADTLYQVSSGASSPTSSTGGVNAKEIGLGTQVASVDKLMTQGNMESTGRSLDMMINGNGYYIVTRGSIDEKLGVDSTNAVLSGTNSGTTAATLYTRDGNFHLDKDGNLVTSSGYRIMGYYPTKGITQPTGSTSTSSTSSKITADETQLANADSTTYATDNLTPLVIPSTLTNGSNTDAVSSFAVGTDGVITVTTGGGKTYAIGQIALANFTNPEGLKEEGNNYLTESTNSGTAQIMSSKSVTSNNNSSTFGEIQTGYLEASNVDLTTEFSSMITTTKSFQAASKMITNGQDILDTIIGLVR